MAVPPSPISTAIRIRIIPITGLISSMAVVGAATAGEVMATTAGRTVAGRTVAAGRTVVVGRTVEADRTVAGTGAKLADEGSVTVYCSPS